jgi:hypothetical protein
MLALVVIGVFFMAGGCSKKQKQPAVQEPQMALSCIGVLPVVSGVDEASGVSFGDAKGLQDGILQLDNMLHKKFMGRDDVRFITPAQVGGLQNAGTENALARARQAANFLSCNGILEMKLLRYKKRVGGAYTAKEPASVSFTYRLLEVNSGTVLCRGRFDEAQQSVMENLYNFKNARKRGFTWVTAEELLREGLESRLNECSYLRSAK